MKYTFTLSGHKPETGDVQTISREKIVLESRTGESDRHIALKILAYVLFSRETAPLPLHIEQGVQQRHKPDLVALDPENNGRVLWWIDCGQIETKRLGRIVRANRFARVLVVKPTDREAIFYARAALPFLPSETTERERTEFAGFGPEFIADFLAVLRGANTLHVAALDGDALRVTLNQTELSTPLTRFSANRFPVRQDESTRKSDIV